MSVRESRLQDADLLARAVENVFRKLIRFLVGRISLVKLQEMIRYIYIEETEKKLKAEKPGKNVPLTRLALLTGLDTRTLTRVREQLYHSAPLYQNQFLAELTPESAIVEAWATLGDEHAVLEYGSEDAEFERLVRSTIPTRGITTQSIIKRLVDTRSVSQNRESGTLRLLVDHFSPYLSDDEPNIINAAFSAIGNLISTVEYNVSAGSAERLFQRQAWSFRLDPEQRLAFRRDMREMLESYEEGAMNRIEPWEMERFGKDLLTAGVGFYYFEEDRPG
ncbi:MAG: hypothetical protein V2I79_03595 [Xanthomonadales bacterium]|jgi:hypothetical protein|nr:hypothetical protein [Xanthomonadales bacterium]